MAGGTVRSEGAQTSLCPLTVPHWTIVGPPATCLFLTTIGHLPLSPRLVLVVPRGILSLLMIRIICQILLAHVIIIENKDQHDLIIPPAWIDLGHFSCH